MTEDSNCLELGNNIIQRNVYIFYAFCNLIDVSAELMNDTYNNVCETAEGEAVEGGGDKIGPFVVEMSQVVRLKGFEDGRKEHGLLADWAIWKVFDIGRSAGAEASWRSVCS